MNDPSKTPPKWLAQWKSPVELLSSFSLGTKKFAQRALLSFDLSQINIDDLGMSTHLSFQHIRWRLVKEEWIPSCSCGYPQGKCLHTALLAMAFNRLAHSQQWPLPFKEEANVINVNYPPRDRSIKREPLFQSQKQEVETTSEVANLLVEADFNDAPNMVTLQFYRLNDQSQKLILSIDQLIGLKRTMDYLKKEVLNGWTAEACSLIRWLVSFFRSKNMIMGRQTLLRLSRNDFLAWRDFWEDHACFLVERESRIQLFRKKKYLDLTFELSLDDNRMKIAPIIHFPDSTEKAPFHTLFQKFQQGGKILEKDGDIYDFAPPVSYKLLTDCFSQKIPSMPVDKIAEYLGPLLENRLDLVFGDLIIHSQKKQALTLKVYLDDSDVKMKVFSGNTEMLIKNGKIEKIPTITHLKNGKFEINNVVDDEILLKINDFLHFFLGDKGRTCIPASSKVFLDLRERIQLLPKEVTITLSEELNNILDEVGEELVPILTIRPYNGHYTMQVRWKVKDTQISEDAIQQAIMRNDSVVMAENGTWHRFNPAPYLEKRAWWGNAGVAPGEVNHLLPYELQNLLIANENKLKKTVEMTPESEENILLDQESRQIIQDILNQPPKEPLYLPERFGVILRDYQRQGFEFLAQRYVSSVGAILADDMGLGKTIQTLALICAIIEQQKVETGKGEKVLILCPASVQVVWQKEAARFAPNLKIVAYVGNVETRKKIFEKKDWDCLLVTYGIARSDDLLLAQHRFSLIILDEAQMIKNRKAKIAISVRKLKADCRLALTGTPLENMILDLWSIMDFLNPDYLGSAEHYLTHEVDPDKVISLKKRIEPLILRRTKKQVAKELPSRTEDVILLEMGTEQRTLYVQMQKQVREILQNGNAKKEAFNALTALMRLRQICCHPALVGVQDIESCKMKAVIEMAEELIEEGHSVLIFSQFVEMLRLVRAAVPKTIKTYELIGETSIADRIRSVDEFNHKETPPALFFISLKAGGTGITLTKADYVFILDPWWNPSVERQAIDRTHRIGQEKPVIAYRFVVKNSVEEEVMKIKEEKAKLFEEIIEGVATGEQTSGKMSLSAEELRKIIFKDF